MDFAFRSPLTTQSHAMEAVQPSQWKAEMAKAARHFHVIGAWVAILFDPLFAVTDYFNIPNHWQEVFALRLSVSFITLLTLWLFKQGKVNIYVLVAIPFALISLQNAYTYSLIYANHLLGHNLNYLALFMGAGLFLLWPVRYSVIAIGLSFAATFFFVARNPHLHLSDLMVNGGLLLGTVAVFTILLIQARYRLRLSEIKAKLALQASLDVTEQQRDTLEKQHKELQKTTEALAISKAEIARINAGLEETVAQRTKALKQSNQEMDRLVYSLSHDFRTPITNVKGLISHALREKNPDMLHTMLRHMESSTNRMDELLQDMINYAVYWNETLQPGSINGKELIYSIWQQFDYAHENVMHLDLVPAEPAQWQLHTDREKLRVVMYTLISNAIRYRQPDTDGHLTISLQHTGDSVQLSFRDEGIGMAPDSADKVFDMFYRGTNRSMGAGMGLYIAKGIVNQLGGQISLTSTPAQGTTVTIALPRVLTTKNAHSTKNQSLGLPEAV